MSQDQTTAALPQQNANAISTRPGSKLVTQTVAKGAAKTFLQAFIGVLALLLVPTLSNWAVDLQKGGTIEVNVDWFVKVLIAATGAGIAALISAVWNWSKSP